MFYVKETHTPSTAQHCNQHLSAPLTVPNTPFLSSEWQIILHWAQRWFFPCGQKDTHLNLGLGLKSSN